MTKKQNIIIVALLVLPTLVLSGLAAKNEIERISARAWRVNIAGYDPRDLLYGRYLEFTYDWGKPLGPCPEQGMCCLCFEPKDGAPEPVVTRMSCDQAKICAASIEATPGRRAASGGFNPERPQRYYIPEESAPRLDTLLRQRKHKMSVDLKITPTGRPMLSELYIDDVPWREFLKRNPEAEKATSRVMPPAARTPPPEPPHEGTAPSSE